MIPPILYASARMADHASAVLRGRGRPRADIDVATVEFMLNMGKKLGEIASMFQVTPGTITRSIERAGTSAWHHFSDEHLLELLDRVMNPSLGRTYGHRMATATLRALDGSKFPGSRC